MKNGSAPRSGKLRRASPPLQVQSQTKSGSDSSPKSDSSKIKLNRTELRLLEKLFTADVFNQSPMQLRSKHLAGLEARGLVEQVQRTLPGRLPVVVKGWALTLRGHYAYCSNC
jgi:hypothetical protein